MEHQPQETKRVWVKGGTIITGERNEEGGGAPYLGTVLIEGDVIRALYSSVDHSGPDALPVHDDDTIINATGFVVCPGLIDTHTHDDYLLLAKNTREDPHALHHIDAAAKISQGVTSIIIGNCGMSLYPIDMRDTPSNTPIAEPLNLMGPHAAFRFPDLPSFIQETAATRTVLNFASLVGHSALRLKAMHKDVQVAHSRACTAEEIRIMQQDLDDAMRAGAVGLSTGLQYPLANKADTDEVVALCEIVAKYNGVYVSHIRCEGAKLEESVEEALLIGRRSGVAVVISHHKCSGKINHGKVKTTLRMIDEAVAQGQKVSFDAYPYCASSTVLSRSHMKEGTTVMIASCPVRPELSGRFLHEVAAEEGVSQLELVDKLIPAAAIYFSMDEADVRHVLSHPLCMIGSDGIPFQDHPHPRMWGAFARVLGHYSRDEKLFSLAEAIRKMTSLPAHTFHLRNRGELKPGNFADILIFDPLAIIDSASFLVPTTPAQGVKLVMVNGQIAYNALRESPVKAEDVHLSARAGAFIALK